MINWLDLREMSEARGISRCGCHWRHEAKPAPESQARFIKVRILALRHRGCGTKDCFTLSLQPPWLA